MKSRMPIVAVGLLLGAMLLSLDVLAPANRRVIKIAGTDPICYFATAHSLLFDRDFDLSNQFKMLRPPAYMSRPQSETGLPPSPYAVGYSILEIPFLAAGTASDRLVGRPADGYSRGALTGFFLGNIVFVTIGLLCVYDAMMILGCELFPAVPSAKRQWTGLVLTLALLPATTLGYYTFAPMSHSAGFMSVSLFFWAWVRKRGSVSVRSWLLLGILGGLAALCRWQNLLLLVAPVLADLLTWTHWANGRTSLAHWVKSQVAFAASAFVVLLPQFAQWKAIYGTYLLNPQGKDFLQFPPRFIPQVLLSSRHGWLIWTPALILCLAGLLWGCVERTAIFLPWTITLGAEVAVIGSITQNFVGNVNNNATFGCRFMTCTLVIPAVGLSYLLLRSPPLLRSVFWGALAVASVYTVAFALQYRLDLVPTDDNLTFSELVSDKFALRRAYRRRSLAKRCSALIEEGNSADCLGILAAGVSKVGADRFVLEARVRAERASGNDQGEKDARARLNTFLAKRLW